MSSPFPANLVLFKAGWQLPNRFTALAHNEAVTLLVDCIPRVNHTE